MKIVITVVAGVVLVVASVTAYGMVLLHPGMVGWWIAYLVLMAIVGFFLPAGIRYWVMNALRIPWRLATWVYGVVACQTGHHRWQWVRRPRYSDVGWVVNYEAVYMLCTRCRVIVMPTYHYERVQPRGGTEAARGEGSDGRYEQATAMPR